MGVGEIERKRYFCEAEFGNWEIRLKRIVRPIVPRPPNIDGNLYDVVPANVAVEEFAKLREFKSHVVPDSRCSLFSPNIDIFCIFLAMGYLR